ncbi:Uma2 family endonuclease [Trichothermofontia sichuanensis B231]|uniref:Uma2 family endonuclease n=1 Tax=Trichothermofontia sichuanensis TaxID=3045816 RepID=UPI0022484860|nr:Uma2 family endonuclease [Trichothermofontia sichuanensis]UZQ55892.1 Uma2 family endonuclease [Trichothermofontia sichuanensis B231]
MTTTPLPPKTDTAEVYLALEVESDIRHEYRNGEIVPMTGGTPAHNEISSLLNALLRVALKGQPYSIFVADQRLWIPAVNLYTYPDVMVTRRPVDLQPGRKDTVMNPILIAEVLSDSTEGYDRGDKFAAYRTIATFQEYLLINQYRYHVEHYHKEAENQWLLMEYREPEANFTLRSLPVTITLGDLYEAIVF